MSVDEKLCCEQVEMYQKRAESGGKPMVLRSFERVLTIRSFGIEYSLVRRHGIA
jgi:hypothetical protein